MYMNVRCSMNGKIVVLFLYLLYSQLNLPYFRFGPCSLFRSHRQHSSSNVKNLEITKSFEASIDEQFIKLLIDVRKRN